MQYTKKHLELLTSETKMIRELLLDSTKIDYETEEIEFFPENIIRNIYIIYMKIGIHGAFYDDMMQYISRYVHIHTPKKIPPPEDLEYCETCNLILK